MGKRGKKYRQPAVTRAVESWKHTHGDKEFTAKDLMESGFIVFRLSTMHINEASVSMILGILRRRGIVRLASENERSKQGQYQAV